MKKYLTNFDEIQLIPSITTNIEHRSECSPYYNAIWSKEKFDWNLDSAHLPLFTAPMSCVVNDKNYLEFSKNKITPIIPRTVPYDIRIKLASEQFWIAMGLEEFECFAINTDTLTSETFICIDIANGHMKKLLELCKFAKHKFDNKLILMAGNIAEPLAYDEYAKAGIDYVRIMIGSGNGCATNDLTGIGRNALYMLRETRYRQEYVAKSYDSYPLGKYRSVPYIVYDGGCNSIRDIIVALAIGADYVMCGKIFAQSQEAAGEIIEKAVKNINNIFTPASENRLARIVEIKDYVFKPGRMYYGMSTERAQKEMGKTEIKHSEGKEYWIPIEYTLSEWTSQFVAAIRSTMSYCNAKVLNEFIGKIRCDIN